MINFVVCITRIVDIFPGIGPVSWRHDANFVVTSVINDSHWCHQWLQSWHNDNSQFSEKQPTWQLVIIQEIIALLRPGHCDHKFFIYQILCLLQYIKKQDDTTCYSYMMFISFYHFSLD